MNIRLAEQWLSFRTPQTRKCSETDTQNLTSQPNSHVVPLLFWRVLERSVDDIRHEAITLIRNFVLDVVSASFDVATACFALLYACLNETDRQKQHFKKSNLDCQTAPK